MYPTDDNIRPTRHLMLTPSGTITEDPPTEENRQLFQDSTNTGVLTAVAAIQNLATAFRERRGGWEPLFRVRPTHVAIYRSLLLDSGSYRTEHCEDVPVPPDRRPDDYGTIFGNVPDSYYDEECENDDVILVLVPYDELTGAAEWVPPVGPAPIWSHPTAALLPRIEMYALICEFIKECY